MGNETLWIFELCFNSSEGKYGILFCARRRSESLFSVTKLKFLHIVVLGLLDGGVLATWD